MFGLIANKIELAEKEKFRGHIDVSGEWLLYSLI